MNIVKVNKLDRAVSPAFFLSAMVFLLVTGTGITAPLLVPYGLSLGLNGFMLGTLFFGFYAIRLLLATPVGILSDKFGVRPVLLFSLIIYLIIAVLYFVSFNYLTLLSARLVHGISSAMMLPMAMAYMGIISPSGKEGKYMSYYNSAVFFANAIGPLTGGLIAEHFGFQGAFVSLFLLAVIALFISWIWLPNVSVTAQRDISSKVEKNINEQNIASKSSASSSSKFFLYTMLMVSFSAAAFSMHSISFFVLYLDDLGIDMTYVGATLSLYNLTIALTQIPFGRLADSSHHNLYLCASCLVVCIMTILIHWIKSFPLIIVSIIFAGLASSLAVVISSSRIAILGKEVGMGKMMGLFSTVQSMGFAFTPLISGVLVDFFSSNSTFFLIALFWAVSLTFSFTIVKK